MQSWLVASGVALVLWATWGVLSKLATGHAGATTLLLVQALGNLLVYAAVAAWLRGHFDVRLPGLWLGLLAGVAGAVGTLFFFNALSRGLASVVVPITALYPLLVTIVSLVALHEPVTWKVVLGVAFAMLAILLFAL